MATKTNPDSQYDAMRQKEIDSQMHDIMVTVQIEKKVLVTNLFNKEDLSCVLKRELGDHKPVKIEELEHGHQVAAANKEADVVLNGWVE